MMREAIVQVTPLDDVTRPAPMKRIAILGCGGSGKSTLAVTLGRLLKLPVMHLDREHWLPGWVEPPKDSWTQRHDELIKQDTWIIDGMYRGTVAPRLAAADTIIFLDFSRWVCLWRIVRRYWKYRGKSRPDMTEGCPEQLNHAFLRWIYRFPEETRPKVVAMIEAHSAGKTVLRFDNPRALKRWLRGWEKRVGQAIGTPAGVRSS